jgi:hypothetical protein
MDLGLSGLQLIGGVVSSYAAGAAVDETVPMEETANVSLLEFAVPYFCEIVDFGVVITEDFDAHNVDPVVTLKTRLVNGGTETTLKALTLGADNTKLTKGDGNFDNVTAIAADTDLDNGDVVHADLSEVTDLKLVPGQILEVEQTTAGTVGSTGSYVPFVLLKISGPDFTASNVWREIGSNEAVGD